MVRFGKFESLYLCSQGTVFVINDTLTDVRNSFLG